MLTRFYVGTGFDKDGAPLASEFVLQCERMALSHFARIYGGATVLNSRGAWIDPLGELIVEQGIVFEVIGQLASPGFEASYLRDLFHQSSVGYVVIEAQTDFV